MELSFRHYYWRWIKKLSFLFILFVCLTTLARSSFALYFGDWNELTQNIPSLLDAMVLGLRFDLMPLAYINAIPFLLVHLAYLVPGKNAIRWIRFFVVGMLCFGYFALAWLYIFDYGFYSYFQDHLNILFFGFFEDDTRALLVTLWKNYNLPLWLGIVFIIQYCFYRFIKFLFSPYDFDLKVRRPHLQVLICFLVGITFLSFAARGNFSRLPLSLEDAHISSNEFINKLSLNGALTLNRAIKIRKTFGRGEYDYLREYGFKDWKEAFTQAYPDRPVKQDLKSSLEATTPYSEYLRKSPPHVILVVMESFGTYWQDKHSAEFNILGELKKHFDQGIYFKNFLPSENGTIGSIVSVITSQAVRPGARFLSESEYMNTHLASAGHLPYKNAGYDTHFVYGGKLGWRDLGKFLSVQKYDHLWGADEIKEAMPEFLNFSSRDLGNEWGIYDEYLFSFIEDQLKTATKPQFFLVLTTSNHPPFEYPTSYNPLPLKLTKEFLSDLTVNEDIARKRLYGFQYSNHKMGEFISRIRASELGEKSVIALTGDHSFWIAKGVGSDEEFKRYAVPFLISAPENLKPLKYDTGKFGSHEDIFPTLYHMTLSGQPYIKLGENLFEDNSYALNGSGLVASDRGAFHHESYWKWSDQEKQILEETQETPELSELRKRAKALIGITDVFLKNSRSEKKAD